MGEQELDLGKANKGPLPRARGPASVGDSMGQGVGGGKARSLDRGERTPWTSVVRCMPPSAAQGQSRDEPRSAVLRGCGQPMNE